MALRVRGNKSGPKPLHWWPPTIYIPSLYSTEKNRKQRGNKERTVKRRAKLRLPLPYSSVYWYKQIYLIFTPHPCFFNDRTFF